LARRPRARPRTLADLNEAAIISRLAAAFADIGGGPAVRLGIGDDAAVLRPRAGRELVVSTDAAVEGVDFRLDRFPLAAVGHRALAQNLSDLAAMGAAPLGFLLTLAAARELPLAMLDRLARGMASLAREVRCPLVGGDLSATSGPLLISITVLGEVERGAALTRGGARVGDTVWVSGALGGVAIGLRRLLAEPGPARVTARGSLARLLRPSPRLSLGRALRRHVSACIDVSDGLAADLARLAAASQVRVELDPQRIPCAGAATPAQACHSGEEFELAFTAPADRATALRRAARRVGVPVTAIGTVRRGRGLAWRDGATLGGGYDHFAAAR